MMVNDYYQTKEPYVYNANYHNGGNHWKGAVWKG